MEALPTSPDEQLARQRLDVLASELPLPGGARRGEVFVERVEIERLELFMVGLTARLPSGEEVVGSAAGAGGFPADRAYLELLERACIQLARARRDDFALRDRAGVEVGRCAPTEVFVPDAEPQRLRASLSNGVALHRSWTQACESACRELVERDRVLRSFRGQLPARAVALPDSPALAALGATYEARAFAFDPAQPGMRHHARGLFLFPRTKGVALAYGFAASRDAEEATEGALGEALQRLAFLWGEEIPERPPAPSPTPDYHQELYLVPENARHLRAWLSPSSQAPAREGAAFDGEPARFADLTPSCLANSVRVVRALSAAAEPLLFGADKRQGHTQPHPIA